MSYESQPASSSQEQPAFSAAASEIRNRPTSAAVNTKRNHGGLPLLNRNPIEFSRWL